MAVTQDLPRRALAKARQTIYPRLPAPVIEYSRIARLLARSAPMTVRGYRFGSGVHPVETPRPSRRLDRKRNALQSYFESHHEGPGIFKGRHYFDLYVQHLAGFVGREVVVVEVGVYSGGSLQMWKSYFGEHATIHGIDIQEACRTYEADGIHIHIGDQATELFGNSSRRTFPLSTC